MPLGLICRFGLGGSAPNRISSRHARFWLTAVFYVLFNTAAAAELPDKQSSIKLLRTHLVDAAWQLHVRNATLTETFQEIHRVSGLRIHFSVLPEELVTATCVANHLSEILKCLLGNSVNLVFSRSGNSTDTVDEVWILGSSLAYRHEHSDCVASWLNQPIDGEDRQTLVQLRAAVNDEDPRRRADAVFDLAKQAQADPAEIESVLLKSLADKSAMVRSQALTGWAQRQGDAALPELQQAMQDMDTSVRLQAVELTENAGLLNQALHDPDILIRQLAESKLQALNP